MARVFLGLGSNLEREHNLRAGLDRLAAEFGALALSPVYDCAAVGFDGPAFLNLVVAVDTELGVAELAQQLRAIEYDHGRPHRAPRFSSRQLDIDILTYDQLVGDVAGVELPRGEILQQAYVLRPLAELAPEAIHPLRGCSYAQLWREFSGERGALSPASFSWSPA
jgi:2-amino-4-hydroxy-6-hydroxymethyldihydropteridine diphosphokinase